MDIMTGLLLLIIGIIAGGYGTIVGAGGGFIFVPALLILLDMDPVIAAGSGLVIVLINSFTGVLGYAKQKKINYKIALTIGISALPGALLGVWLLQAYSSQYFYVIFATILVGLGIFLFSKNSPWEGKLLSKKKQPERNAPKDAWFIPLGLVMGILSSYLGIGGGWLLVPILIYVFHVPTHRAAATSILSLCLYSLIGVLSQLYYSNIDWMTVVFGGTGVILGANIGVFLSQRIPGKVILQMLSVVLVIIGVRMYFQ
ncbi:sulfite exporter TauE/SafE family protein [Virgibacillus halodenitrificans]|uniref:sulfite exporter TauE/SafE family protein n=1 Tax=Virgibacillus halodenitrificans TaxID=1482 RepID=UPI001F24C6E9|nr:sulfite exporter TauE/SafE family protein [Virgibacillus halodenitrificans]MCG1027200.1 sulfite exporter TauE/SafE family protein [Virgibacillus halodenitrificans]